MSKVIPPYTHTQTHTDTYTHQFELLTENCSAGGGGFQSEKYPSPSKSMEDSCYCKQQSWGKVMFLHLSVILFTGESAPLHAGIYTPPATRGRHPSPRSTHTPEQCMLGDTGNKRAVRILLECNLLFGVWIPHCVPEGYRLVLKWLDIDLLNSRRLTLSCVFFFKFYNLVGER